MLCEQMCGIDFAPDLAQLNGGIFDALLDPEGSGVDMTKLTESAPTSDADRGRGVGPHP